MTNEDSLTKIEFQLVRIANALERKNVLCEKYGERLLIDEAKEETNQTNLDFNHKKTQTVTSHYSHNINEHGYCRLCGCSVFSSEAQLECKGPEYKELKLTHFWSLTSIPIICNLCGQEKDKADLSCKGVKR